MNWTIYLLILLLSAVVGLLLGRINSPTGVDLAVGLAIVVLVSRWFRKPL
jgi:hypothetical protein